MKIFIVGPAYPYRGGIADTNESLARALQDQGHEVKLITFKMQYPGFLFPGKSQLSPNPQPKNISIQRWINSMNPLNWINTARKINKEEPNVVIIRYWLPFMAPCLGSIARLLNKNCKVLGFCDNVIPHEKRPGDQQLSKYFISSCDAFICLSNKVNEELKTFTDKKIICIPHPINDNLGKKLPKQIARQQLKLNLSGNYILFFGLVRKYKGLDLLLRAMAEQTVREKNIKLIVAGEFYEDKNEYLEFIRSNAIEENVIIIDQFIPTDAIKLYFSAVDMVAQTYHTASQSGVSQLAYNFDKPILVTDVGGLSETVPHMKVGYVVKKDPKKIAAALVDFYENKREHSFVANVQIEKIQFSWKNFSEELLNFIKYKIE